MSHPTIGIGHRMSHPVTPCPIIPKQISGSSPQPRNLMVRYSRFSIRHTEFGIRNSESQNRESGIPESWCGRVGHFHPSWSHEVHKVLILWML